MLRLLGDLTCMLRICLYRRESIEGERKGVGNVSVLSLNSSYDRTATIRHLSIYYAKMNKSENEYFLGHQTILATIRHLSIYYAKMNKSENEYFLGHQTILGCKSKLPSRL